MVGVSGMVACVAMIAVVAVLGMSVTRWLRSTPSTNAGNVEFGRISLEGGASISVGDPLPQQNVFGTREDTAILRLDDATTAHMRARTRLQRRESNRLQLLAGSTDFEVTDKDKDMFVVAGDVSMRTTDGTFSVALWQHRVSITVRDGEVDLARRGYKQRLRAGETWLEPVD